MKIATLNIEWAKQSRKKIENFLNDFNFDFLILTEAINLDLPKFKYKYFCEQIPEDFYERVNYASFLKGEKAFRTILYSNFQCTNQHIVKDGKTSLALEFETDLGNVIVYSTIIGTQYNKKPYAKKELENCIQDCENIYKFNQNLIIVGDLNTSFQESEKLYTINSETTESLKNLFQKLSLFAATDKIGKNIDHIIIPKSLENRLITSREFVEINKISDHKGVLIELE